MESRCLPGLHLVICVATHCASRDAVCGGSIESVSVCNDRLICVETLQIYGDVKRLENEINAANLL